MTDNENINLFKVQTTIAEAQTTLDNFILNKATRLNNSISDSLTDELSRLKNIFQEAEIVCKSCMRMHGALRKYKGRI